MSVMVNGAAAGVTSFGTSGPNGINMGPISTGDPSGFRGRTVLESQRYAELDRRESYYAGAHHDTKRYDFDGRLLTLPSAGSALGVGALATQPILSQSPVAHFVPLRDRRPMVPYRLPSVIVNTFTAMIFGEQRFPSLVVKGDEDSQDFLQAIISSGSLPQKMIQARTIGGSVGTTGISWCFDRQGRPRFHAHNGKHLFVHAWEDPTELIVKHVSEVLLASKDEWDTTKRKYMRNWYWVRRDWTPDADVLFFPQKFEAQKEPEWVINESESNFHKHGICHFEWIQNLPSPEPDGLPDYHGLYEQFEALDILASIVMKGGIMNLDPTLVLSVDPMLLDNGIVRKGSDNSLAVGPEGDANYLELTGQSLDAGLKLLAENRRAILEAAQCVIPDPDTVAAQGTSSVAMKMMHAPTLARCDIIREQYAKPMKRVLTNMLTLCQRELGTKTITQVTRDVVEQPDGTSQEVEWETEEQIEVIVALPPKIVEEPLLDQQTGQPVVDPTTGQGQLVVRKLPRRPGEGGEIEWMWPPYFPPTSDDQSKIVTTLSTATGGKAVISQETAVQITAQAFGQAPEEEVERVKKMRVVDSQDEIKKAAAYAAAAEAQAFAGGQVGSENELPEGAEPKPGDEGDPDAEGDPGITPPGPPNPFKEEEEPAKKPFKPFFRGRGGR